MQIAPVRSVREAFETITEHRTIVRTTCSSDWTAKGGHVLNVKTTGDGVPQVGRGGTEFLLELSLAPESR